MCVFLCSISPLSVLNLAPHASHLYFFPNPNTNPVARSWVANYLDVPFKP